MICTSCLVVICGFTMTSFSPFSGTAVSTSAAVGITAVLIGTVALLVWALDGVLLCITKCVKITYKSLKACIRLNWERISLENSLVLCTILSLHAISVTIGTCKFFNKKMAWLARLIATFLILLLSEVFDLLMTTIGFVSFFFLIIQMNFCSLNLMMMLILWWYR